MMHVMTDEEIKRTEQIIAGYRNDGTLRGQIIAALMDTKICGAGLYEQTATQKADAILKLLEEAYR